MDEYTLAFMNGDNNTKIGNSCFKISSKTKNEVKKPNQNQYLFNWICG
jgi:hypothetical protein